MPIWSRRWGTSASSPPCITPYCVAPHTRGPCTSPLPTPPRPRLLIKPLNIVCVLPGSDGVFINDMSTSEIYTLSLYNALLNYRGRLICVYVANVKARACCKMENADLVKEMGHECSFATVRGSTHREGC